MKVIRLESYGRNTSGTMLGGVCEFDDGKEWRWHRSIDTGKFYFTIDSGVPSQWGFCNYGRIVAYPKRVAALVEKLTEMGEL